MIACIMLAATAMCIGAIYLTRNWVLGISLFIVGVLLLFGAAYAHSASIKKRKE